MSKRAKSTLLVVLGGLALIYLTPPVYLLLVPPRHLPRAVSSRPASLPVEQLVDSSSAVLLQTSWGLSNAPFPNLITGGSVSCPETPAPRIRTVRSSRGGWYRNIINVVYFPVFLFARLGMMGPLFVVMFAIAYFPKLVRWRKVTGFVVWLLFVVVLCGTAYWLGVWPRVLREHNGPHLKLLRESSPLLAYVRGEAFNLDRHNTLRDQVATRLAVVNGTNAPVDLYADGLWFDRIPPKDIRDYSQLTPFSRLTGVNTVTHGVVNDFFVPKREKDGSSLIYNVGGADTLSLEEPPTYNCI